MCAYSSVLTMKGFQMSQEQVNYDGLMKQDISQEEWRKYEWEYLVMGQVFHRTYLITKPVLLFTRKGGTTHRVVDSTGVAHCIPAPGQMGCVLRWYNGEGKEPVNF